VLKKQVKDERRFPTVIEGNVEDNRLFFTVHNVYRKQIVKRFSLAARKIATMAMALVLAGLSQVASAKPSFILPEMANARKLVGELRKAAPDALIALPTRFSGSAQLGDAAAAWLMYILGAK
jgi:hypothetical protein